MAISSHIAHRSGKGLAGDTRELTRRLGAPEDLVELGSALATPGPATIVDVASLRGFLSSYVTSVLIPVELPLVRRGFDHASNGAISELIELDQAHMPAGLAETMAEASRQAGRKHLGRMRPLRGERRVQRYWRAVQRGETHAWHTVVYSLVLAVYALPLRQGLLNFGCQTIRGFVGASRDRLCLDEAECQELEREMEAKLAPAIEGLLAGAAGPKLLTV
jgi:urease accessory protein UreF